MTEHPERRENRRELPEEHRNMQDGGDSVEPQECAFFLKNGTCAYGDRCKFRHPIDKAPKVRFNSLGLPMRPSEPECAFFSKHLMCGYGHTCKYHHPEPPKQATPVSPQITGLQTPPTPMMISPGYGIQYAVAPMASPPNPSPLQMNTMAGYQMYAPVPNYQLGAMQMMHSSGDPRYGVNLGIVRSSGNSSDGRQSAGRNSDNSREYYNRGSSGSLKNSGSNYGVGGVKSPNPVQHQPKHHVHSTSDTTIATVEPSSSEGHDSDQFAPQPIMVFDSSNEKGLQSLDSAELCRKFDSWWHKDKGGGSRAGKGPPPPASINESE